MLRAGAAAAFCAAAIAFGCEADGRIWMPMTDLADPLFRFVLSLGTTAGPFLDTNGRLGRVPAL